MGIESIKLDHLRYFIAAIETGSFAAAGKKLNITSTSIAHGITSLEAQIGIELLIRRRASGIKPNSDGRKFAISARKVIMEAEALVSIYENNPGELTGELTVGCQEALTWSVAPRVVEELLKSHPGLNVSVKTVFMDEKFSPLDSGAVDLMLTFVTHKIDEPGLYSEILCQPNTYALMRAGHPALSKANPKIALKHLAKFPHIFIQDGPAFPLFYDMYKERNLEPEVHMVSNISPGAQSFVGISDAVCLRIVRPSIKYSPLGDELTYTEVQDSVQCPDVVVATHMNSQSEISQKARAFIEVTRQKFKDGTLKDNFFY